MIAEQLTFAALRGLVDDRCYPVLIPIDKELPALAYARVSTDPISSMDCPNGMGDVVLVQVDVVAATYLETVELSSAVRTAMTDTGKASLQSMIDIQTDNPMIYRRVVTFTLMEF